MSIIGINNSDNLGALQTYLEWNGQEAPGKKLLFDEEKAKEDAKYDGYYCIITSELEMLDQRVIEIYRGLSEIEDNFKVSKSNLEIRPVYEIGRAHA